MEHQTPKVSVCIVTYNQEQYIEECLQSVVNQEVDFPIEVIVSDDCSTDRTPEIIQRFANKYPFIKPVLRDKNIGAGMNFIDTHNRAIGEYVCHLDGDDRWLPGKLKFQLAFMDSNPDYAQMWHFARRIDDAGKVVNIFPSWLAKYFYPKTLAAKDIALSYALVGHHSTQMYRRSARQSLNINDTGFVLDFWFAFRYALNGKSYYAKEIYSDYRITIIDSITRSKSPKRVTVDLLSEHLIEIAKNYPEYAKYVKANMRTRRFFSRIRGHNLEKIDGNIEILKDVSDSFWLFLKSCFYFGVQKI